MKSIRSRRKRSALLWRELSRRIMRLACTRSCDLRETLRFFAPWKTPSAGSDRKPQLRLLLLFFFGTLVGLRQILAGFFQRSEGVVVGLQCLPVLSDCALALAGNIEDFSQLQAAPDFRPAGIAVAIQRSTVSIGGGLIVPLEEENFGDAIVRQRAVLVEIESLVEFSERAREISLLLHRHASQDRRAQLHIA